MHFSFVDLSAEFGKIDYASVSYLSVTLYCNRIRDSQAHYRTLEHKNLESFITFIKVLK